MRYLLDTDVLGELRKPAARADGSVRAARLRTWLECDVLGACHGRTLGVDLAVARRAASTHVSDPCSERDALVAATAVERGLTVVTRNTAGFDRHGVPLLDPWQAP